MAAHTLPFRRRCCRIAFWRDERITVGRVRKVSLAIAGMMQQQQMDDHAPKVNAFRSFCLQLTEQLCAEFEREVRQMSEDILRYRGELARCADLLAFQLGKEKTYHNMLENIAGNTSQLVGKAGEVGQKHGQNDQMKQQIHEMLEAMFHSGKGGLNENLANLDDHRQMTETHLMTSAELQNQSAAVQKELDNILETLKMPPVSYQQAPIMMGPSQMGGPGGGMQQQQFRPPSAGMNAPMNGGMVGNGMMGSPAGSQGMMGASPRNRSQPGSPVYGGPPGQAGPVQFPMAGMQSPMSPSTPGAYSGGAPQRMNNTNYA